MKTMCHLFRIFTMFVSFTVLCGGAFANDLLIILPYDSTYVDTRSDPQWIEIGEMFANYKNRTGLDARAITLEDVKRWEEGADEAEQVKRTIHRFVRDQGTRYVMLVGDTGVFPIRQQFTGYTVAGDTFYEGESGAWLPTPRDYYRFFPTDAYFANLWADDAMPDTFDTWNANGNHLFGEMYNDALRSEDDFSIHPDVAVGRVLADTPNEFFDYFVKVMRFETRIGDYAGEQAVLLTAGAIYGSVDSIRELAPFFDSGHNVTQLWRTDPDYQYDGDFGTGRTDDPAGYIEEFFNFYLPHFVHYAGHGNSDSWAEPGLDTAGVLALGNHSIPAIVTASACNTARFAQRQQTTSKPVAAPADLDEDGMAEAWTTQAMGGGVVYIASTTGIILPIGHDLWPPFYSAIFDDGIVAIGDAFRQAIVSYIDENGLERYPDTGSWHEDATWPDSSGGFYQGSVGSFAPAVTTLLFGDPSLRIQGVDYLLTPPTTRAEFRRWVNGVDLGVGSEYLHEVIFHASDEETRVSATYWKAQEMPDGPWSAFQEESVAQIPIDLSSVNEGDQLLFSYYSKDDEGNVEISNTDEIRFDFTPPVTTVYLNGLRYRGSGSRPIPVGDVNMELRATDETSGVKYIEYIFGEGSDTTRNPGARFPLSFDFPCFSGTFLIRFRAVDEAGNVEKWQTVTIQLEPVPAAGQFCKGEWIEDVRFRLPPKFHDTLPLLEFFERPDSKGKIQSLRFESQGPFETIDESLAIKGNWRDVGNAKKKGGVWRLLCTPKTIGTSGGFFRIRAVVGIGGKAKAMPPYWIFVKKEMETIRGKGEFSKKL